MSPARRHCAATDCSKTVRAGDLMCSQHWFLVPKPEQREVYRTWRDWCAGTGDFNAYKVAVAAAVKAVEQAEIAASGFQPVRSEG